MTKEEAIFCEKSYIGETNCADCKYYSTDTCQSRVSHKMAIKALEQEPCDDCVSRRTVFETIDDCNSDGLKGIFCSYDDGERFKEYIKKLPPVTPTRKKGKWIAKENIHGLEKFYECSNCGNHCLYKYVEIGFQNAKTKFCPNCGAEMEGEE